MKKVLVSFDEALLRRIDALRPPAVSRGAPTWPSWPSGSSTAMAALALFPRVRRALERPDELFAADSIRLVTDDERVIDIAAPVAVPLAGAAI